MTAFPLGLILSDVEFRFLLLFARSVMFRMKIRLICSLAAKWPHLFIGLYVVGGICLGSQLVLIRIGWSGLILSGWALRLKGFWKAFFMCRGGACGTSVINSFLPPKSLVKMFCLMILFLVLSIGVYIEVKLSLDGIVGFNILT